MAGPSGECSVRARDQNLSAPADIPFEATLNPSISYFCKNQSSGKVYFVIEFNIMELDA